MPKISKSKLYTSLILLLVFCIFQLSVIRLYGFSLYPDEFGYWASAAKSAGYDWSKLASLGSYYSFGYSLILRPGLCIFKGGITAYRAAIAINYIMIGGIFILLVATLKRVVAGMGPTAGTLICACSAFYPPLVLYSQMTMAETLLTFLFVLTSYFFAGFINKPGVVNLMLLVVSVGYMYCVHMRSIGVIVSLILTYLILGIADKKSRNYVLLFVGAIGVALVVFVIIKRNVISNVFAYADAEDLNVNSYGSQGWKIRDIFTGPGFVDFMIEVFGKLYYLTVSTFGTFVFLCISAVKGVINIIRSAEYKEPRRIISFFSVFVLLSTLSEVMISAIYMHGSDRADSLLYGRYEELVGPVVIMLGLVEICSLIKDSDLKSTLITTIGTILGLAILTPVFIGYFEKKNYYRMRGFFVSGIGYLNEYYQYDPKGFMIKATFVGIIGMIIFTGAMILAVRFRNPAFFIGIILLLQIILGVRLGIQWTYRINDYVYSNLRLTDKFKQSDRALYYLNGDDNLYVDFVQFQLPDREIVILNPDELSNADMSNGYLIVNWNYEGIEEVTAMYGGYLESEMFRVFYDG